MALSIGLGRTLRGASKDAGFLGDLPINEIAELEGISLHGFQRQLALQVSSFVHLSITISNLYYITVNLDQPVPSN